MGERAIPDEELASLVRLNHSGAHSCVPPCPAGLLERLRRLEEAVDAVLAEPTQLYGGALTSLRAARAAAKGEGG